MTKYEFLKELELALTGKISPQAIEVNINYYRDYIQEQIMTGKSEAEVLQMLGSPSMIAKSIINAEQAKREEQGSFFDAGDKENKNKKSVTTIICEMANGKWYEKACVAAIVILLIIFVVRFAIALIKFLFWPVVFAIIAYVVWKYIKANKM